MLRWQENKPQAKSAKGKKNMEMKIVIIKILFNRTAVFFSSDFLQKKKKYTYLRNEIKLVLCGVKGGS